MHLYHEHVLFPLLESTVLNCENRIFKKFLLIFQFFRKLSNIAFVCLLCPAMPKHLKKSLDYIVRCSVS